MTFKDALKTMLKTNEFEKLIKNTKGKDKKQAVEFYNAIKDADLDKIPEIVLLTACYSYSVLRDTICFMEIKEDGKKD